MSLRVLHCPALIGGNAPQLARAERAIGLDSRCVALTGSRYAYEADEILAGPDAGFRERESARWRLLARALRWADVVHLNFGATIMPPRADLVDLPADRAGRARAHAFHLYARLLKQRDLPLLRRAGKVVAMTYQGNDARQGDRLDRFAISPAAEVGPGYYPPGSDAAKRREIARVDRYADLIYALNPDLLHVLPARTAFLPYANVDPAAVSPGPPRPGSEVPVVAHAPTNRAVKGTRFLLEALERLRSDGVAFELRLLEGLTSAEVRRELAGADLVVDQVLVGWYGGVATEAMALGRPVVAYVREEDLGPLPAEMLTELPVISASPDTLEPVLREWLTTRRGELADLGARSRAFVERWHDPRGIATRLAADYEGARTARGLNPAGDRPAL